MILMQVLVQLYFECPYTTPDADAYFAAVEMYSEDNEFRYSNFGRRNSATTASFEHDLHTVQILLFIQMETQLRFD